MLYYRGMGTVKWKLQEVLQHHNIRPRDVETEAIRLGYNFGKNTIYRLLKDDGPINVNRETLSVLIAALRSLTKQQVEVEDILEYQE
jgi:hypothetical protein